MKPVTETELHFHQAAAGADVRRVTQADLDRHVLSEFYVTADKAVWGHQHRTYDQPHDEAYDGMGRLTLCILVLRNGITLVGNSACVDPKMYDATIGQRLAREDAMKQLWPMLGFQLAQEMHGGMTLVTNEHLKQLEEISYQYQSVSK